MELVEAIDALIARMRETGESQEQVLAQIGHRLLSEMSAEAWRDLSQHMANNQDELHQWLVAERLRLRAGSC